MNTQLEELLTKRDFAQAAQSSLRTIDYWMEHGLIPFIKLGKLVRFTRSDVEKFIQAHRIGGK